MNLQVWVFQSRLFAKQLGGVSQGTGIVFLSTAHFQQANGSLSLAKQESLCLGEGSSVEDPRSKVIFPALPHIEEATSALLPLPQMWLWLCLWPESDVSSLLFNMAGGL